ncbi:hypothetical protein EHP00_2474 [Ecytonucleospora hepatopenaei]|uniref:Uncharacterized protein n=1 Tax=Ecytonucleospora hepatopenaei TaxID=646526 RepID=A0A1W0E8N7_9MICR|nr:hypothetical protein EHP00_2474 [Ecytonucleospora hepatopenaei]
MHFSDFNRILLLFCFASFLRGNNGVKEERLDFNSSLFLPSGSLVCFVMDVNPATRHSYFYVNGNTYYYANVGYKILRDTILKNENNQIIRLLDDVHVKLIDGGFKVVGSGGIYFNLKEKLSSIDYQNKTIKSNIKKDELIKLNMDTGEFLYKELNYIIDQHKLNNYPFIHNGNCFKHNNINNNNNIKNNVNNLKFANILCLDLNALKVLNKAGKTTLSTELLTTKITHVHTESQIRVEVRTDDFVPKDTSRKQKMTISQIMMYMLAASGALLVLCCAIGFIYMQVTRDDKRGIVNEENTI